jgi:hypothetical protein
LVESERARRSRLASFILLGLLVTGGIFLSAGAGDIPTLLAILGGMTGVIIALIFNRVGLITVAGLLTTAVLIVAVFSAILSAPGGQLSPDYLPSYDILVLAVVVAGSLLNPAAAFFVALFNSAAIAADFLVLQPHTADLTTELNQDGLGLLLGRPIGLEIFVAVVAYLWVSGTLTASRRADQAEAYAALEHAYAQQTRQLQYGVNQILATHVRIANGDLSARAPLTQDNVLWQIAASLNNMVERLRASMGQAAQAGRAAYQLSRTEGEAQRLAQALRDLQQGRQPIWPQPTGTAIDQILAIVRPQRPNVLPSGSGWGTSPMGDRSSFPPGSQSQPGMFPNNPSTWAPPFTSYPDATGPLSDSRMRGLSGLGQGYNTPGQEPAGQAYPAQPPTSALGQEENWPSLDIRDAKASPNSSTADGSSSGRQSDPFPPLDNPWYLPPDE